MIDTTAILGPKLWGKLSVDDRSTETLKEFKRCIRGKDLTNLIEAGWVSLHPLLNMTLLSY